MRDPHSPPPPPPPVKPAGTSVMLPLGIRCCGAAESFPRKEGGWRPACSHVGSGCTGALGPPWRPRLQQPRCKARGRPSSSAKCSILPTVGEDPGAVLDLKQKERCVVLIPSWGNVIYAFVVARPLQQWSYWLSFS